MVLPRRLAYGWLPTLLLVAACRGETPAPTSPTSPAPPSAPAAPATGNEDASFAGSASCRECHARFYELWAPSHHGTAMQPFSAQLAEAELAPAGEDLVIGNRAYRFEVDDESGFVLERGAAGERRFPVEHVMGGKNVYFFLTPFERGRLQVLPIAYDVRRRDWYDTTASMVRHSAGASDEQVDWTDPLLTFNTSCWNCHVSQLSVNYDPASDVYESTWQEPGINCETCHGPGAEHVRAFREAPPDRPPDALKLTSVRALSAAQRNDACSTCHAKATPLSRDWSPGERFFDHFDLVTLEHADFYPDGRDLGENYTTTLWRMSPCAKASDLDCIDCHTSSGRYRFAADTTAAANGACLPCHAERVADAAAHTHHAADGEGSRCVACHMPMTEFARMRRSDHSMRPPAPALTLAHGSPNACNVCHTDRDAAWADERVREWRERDYQAPLLEQAELIAAARRGDWAELDAMLAAIGAEGRDEIVATSLIRLLAACPDPATAPALMRALEDPSPLVRSAAAATLENHLSPVTVRALLERLTDDFRLVRVRAAGALAGVPRRDLDPGARARLDAALDELDAALASRPDDWASRYSLGNLHAQRGRLDAALGEYRAAIRLRDDVIPPLVNAAQVYARRGQLAEAETALRQALRIEPDNAVANLDLGLLVAEQGNRVEAERLLEAAFAADPTLAQAAFNLAVLAGERDPQAAVAWSRRAWELRPERPRYAHTHAFYLLRAGAPGDAASVLERSWDGGAVDADVVQLLALVYSEQGRADALPALYARAAADVRLPPQAREAFGRMGRGGVRPPG